MEEDLLAFILLLMMIFNMFTHSEVKGSVELREKLKSSLKTLI